MHTCEEVYGGHECWHKGWWARATHEHTVAVSVGREHALAPACIRVLSKSYPSSEIWIFRLVEHTEQNVTLRYARWEGVASECKPQYRPAASTRRVLLIWTTYLRSVFLLAFPPCRRIVNVAHPPFTRSCCSPCVEQFHLNNHRCWRRGVSTGFLFFIQKEVETKQKIVKDFFYKKKVGWRKEVVNSFPFASVLISYRRWRTSKRLGNNEID